MDIKIAKPILSKITIKNLFGYKNFEISFRGPVKIIAADNGAGKTTFLTIIQSVLDGKLSQLSTHEFQSITWLFRNTQKNTPSTKLTIKHSDFRADSDSSELRIWWDKSETTRRFRQYVSFSDLLSLVSMYRSQQAIGGPIFENIWRQGPHSRTDIKNIVVAASHQFSLTPETRALEEITKRQMNDVKVLWLPTYRRIEADLSHLYREEASQAGTQYIFFGLKDVEKKLKDITDRIRNETFKGYIEINSKTLDTLLSTDSKNKDSSGETRIDIDIITLILGRIGKQTNQNLIDRLQKLHSSGEIEEPAQRVLREYLQNLSKIYEKQQAAELSLQKFTEVVNNYWKDSVDAKEFVYDKLQANVKLVNLTTGKSIPLQALSSGEKQIVSIFARLYLDENAKYFVIIDEPEISLSIEWQKRFLVDIANSPACTNLLAITHSPFIFQNELRKFASPLKLSFSKKITPRTYTEEEEEENDDE